MHPILEEAVDIAKAKGRAILPGRGGQKAIARNARRDAQDQHGVAFRSRLLAEQVDPKRPRDGIFRSGADQIAMLHDRARYATKTAGRLDRIANYLAARTKRPRIKKAGGKQGRAHWNGGRPRSKASHREFMGRLQDAQDRRGHLETLESPGTNRIRRATNARIVAGNLRRLKAGGPVKKAKVPKTAKPPGVLRGTPIVARLGLTNNRLARRLAAAEERAKTKKDPVKKASYMGQKVSRKQRRTLATNGWLSPNRGANAARPGRLAAKRGAEKINAALDRLYGQSISGRRSDKRTSAFEQRTIGGILRRSGSYSPQKTDASGKPRVYVENRLLRSRLDAAAARRRGAAMSGAFRKFAAEDLAKARGLRPAGGSSGLLRRVKRMQGHTANSYSKAERVKYLIAALTRRVEGSKKKPQAAH